MRADQHAVVELMSSETKLLAQIAQLQGENAQLTKVLIELEPALQKILEFEPIVDAMVKEIRQLRNELGLDPVI